MAKIVITARKPDLNFAHKNSEISYDPTNKFHQSTFPADFEELAYDFIDSFVDMIFSDEKLKDFGALPRDRNMTDFYFDIIIKEGNLSWERYSAWYYNKKAKFQEAVKKIIVNAVNQRAPLKIENLEFFTWLSVVNFISSMTEDYFLKHMEQLNIMKETLMNFLGRAFEIVLEEIYEDTAIGQLRAEKNPDDKWKITPLINRYTLVYNDIAEMPHVEKNLFSGDGAVFIDRLIQGRLLHIFEITAKVSRRFALGDKIRHVAADMAGIRLMLSHKSDRRIFIKLAHGDREFMQKLVAKHERAALRAMLREIVCETGSSQLVNVIRQEESIEDMLFDVKLRTSVVKVLKEIGNKKCAAAARYARHAADRVERSLNKFFNRLSQKEFEDVVLFNIENLSYFHRTIDNFFEVRSRYGKKSAYSDELTGIKIFRQTVIRPVKNEGTGRESMQCMPIPDDQKTRIENLYEEGSLFYMRGEGALYPGVEGSSIRSKKLFMFADLRNSTETTMKLTKDTAGFLTPYLNTVYSVSKEHNGTEIYFAGDGYAAHFGTAIECVRTAYMIHAEFVKLRREAEDKIKLKEKELYKELVRIKAITPDMKIAGKTGEPGDVLTAELVDFLKIVSRNRDVNVETAIRTLAEEYSMPKVEIGIGITLGELFFAVVGEGEVRFNIVLSPSLTQAARLSGSNPEVKQYLEKKFGLKNIPRKVYVNEKKLFNQGIVITTDVFNMLRGETDINMIEQEKIGLSHGVYYYYDSALNRYIALTKMEQGIVLKGIEGDVEVFEVLTPATSADSFANDWIAKNKKS